METRYKSARRVVLIVMIVPLLGVALVYMLNLRITERERTNDARQELFWMKRAVWHLTSLREALMCFEKQHKSLPPQAVDLLRSGCLDSGDSFVVSDVPVYELPPAFDPGWDRLDQVLIRKATALPLSSDSVVAILLPDQRYKAKCFVLTSDGSILCVMQSDWEAWTEKWRNRLGGADLWPRKQ